MGDETDVVDVDADNDMGSSQVSSPPAVVRRRLVTNKATLRVIGASREF